MMKKASLLLVLQFSATLLLFGNEADSARSWITGKEQWSELEAGRAILIDSSISSKENGDSHSATAALLVDAAPDVVRTVVEDGDKAAGFQEALVSSEIIDRTGSVTLVRQIAKVGLHKVGYVVRQTAENPQLMNFELVDGDLKSMSGFWRFLPVPSEEGTRTLLVYRLSLEPNAPIPGFLVRRSIAICLPQTLVAVRNETLRRAESS